VFKSAKAKSGILPLQLILLSQIFSMSPALAVDSKPFKAGDYPASQISSFHKQLGKLAIDAKQVMRTNEKQSNPRYCRAWIWLAKNGKKESCEYFDDINSLGGSNGLFAPNTVLPAGYACIIKLGDYDGRLVLINESGRHWNLPGGTYFVSRDKKNLFSIHETETKTGVSVFDLKNGKVALAEDEKSKDVPPIMDKWYEDGTSYFFTTMNADGTEPKEKIRTIYAFDNKTNRFLKKSMPAAKISAAKVVVYDFDATSQKDRNAARLK
jgi:hypothetical protein